MKPPQRHRTAVIGWRMAHAAAAGFTLLELLVVIAVIALLMSTGLLVMGNILQSAREKATMATIVKVNGMLQERQEAFQRMMEKKGPSAPIASIPALLRAVERGDLNASVTLLKLLQRTDLQGQTQFYLPEIDPAILDSASDRTWEAMGRKLCFRIKFPMTFLEVCGFNGKPGTPDVDDDGNSFTDFRTDGIPLPYYQYPDPMELGLYQAGTSDVDRDDLEPYATLIRERMTDPSKHDPKTQSAAMLYLILTAGDFLGVPPVGNDQFSTSEVRDTDGDGLLEFVDAWGEPLRFFRWPTRLLRCGEDAFTGDTDGDGTTPEPAGPNNDFPDPRYAALMMDNLPVLVLDTTLPLAQRRQQVEALTRDPDDGMNLIYIQVIKRNAQTTRISATPTTDRELNARLKLESLFHTPETLHTVLVVSAGVDRELGLYEPCQFSTYSASNVYGHLAQLKQLGDPTENPISDNLTNRKR
jgi:prepilin-type N-terminal cleavage/methylation domain-containing protein